MDSSTLNQLVARIQGGEAHANEELKGRLHRHMLPIVRRAMRTGSAVNPLSRLILAEARCVSCLGRPTSPAVAAAEWHVEQVAERVCNAILRDAAAWGHGRIPHPQVLGN